MDKRVIEKFNDLLKDLNPKDFLSHQKGNQVKWIKADHIGIFEAGKLTGTEQTKFPCIKILEIQKIDEKQYYVIITRCFFPERYGHVPQSNFLHSEGDWYDIVQCQVPIEIEGAKEKVEKYYDEIKIENYKIVFDVKLNVSIFEMLGL